MNRRAVRSLVIGSIALGLGVAGTLVANAQWAIPGRAAVQVTTAGMPAGSTPTARKQGDNVVVRWEAQAVAPGVPMRAYVVTARDTQAPARPAVTHTVPASGADCESTAFTLAELGNGKWDWTVVPRYQLWSGPEGPHSSPAVPVGGNQAAIAPAAPAPAAPAARTTATANIDATPSTTATATEMPPADPATPEPVKTVAPEKTQGPEADPAATEGPSAINSEPVS